MLLLGENIVRSVDSIHIIAYYEQAKNEIVTQLTMAGVPMTNVDFYIFKTNDVWECDNKPIYVSSNENKLTIEDGVVGLDGKG